MPAFARLALAHLMLLALAACSQEPAYDTTHDYFSHANSDAFVTEHLALDLDVDFPARQLRGTATLHMRNLLPFERSIVLDTRDLDISAVRVNLPGDAPQAAQFALGEPDPELGAPLEIKLPDGFDPQGGFELAVDYATSPAASALQWLPPELTAGGQFPLLFSQSQAIHARSWVPLQDTPAVRITYEAVIRTPPELLAVMSADNDPLTPRDGEYRFSMPQPIPSYLLAIAAGNLYFAPIGERTGVYTEPELLDASLWEFAETQAMLELAEQRFGPYDWGRYDLLILPPSFPYGGMENPRLSFITPSVLAGDRSLVSLIAHELAHSWSGNLVTNATWRDIWLNEGTTSYLEARLMEELFSKERADEERVLSWEALQSAVDEVPEHLQALAPEILPSDGEFAQQGMQYAKGQFFLEHMERLFGRERFDPFLMAYFRHFSWQSITTEQFLDYLDEHLLSRYPGIYSREAAGEWLYQPGVPADFQPPQSAALAQSAEAARAWAAGDLPLAAVDISSWSPQATVQFINALPEGMTNAQMQALEDRFAFSASGNVEITLAWFSQVAKRRFEPAYPALREHLAAHGRTKLVAPLYGALADNGEDAALAKQWFEELRGRYHPITVNAIERALQAPAGSS
jgi:aminopeptidase N